jgi:hypothetical protein
MGPNADYVGSGDVCEPCIDEGKVAMTIRLKARVTELHDASKFPHGIHQGVRRMVLRITQADSQRDEIAVPYSGDEWQLGDEFTLVVESPDSEIVQPERPAYTPAELHHVFLEMVQHGGYWEKFLGDLGIRSDIVNRQKIAETWPKVIARFANKAGQ